MRDEIAGESNSISNQRRILKKPMRAERFFHSALVHGRQEVSAGGPTFKDPVFKPPCLQTSEAGEVGTVIVKDMVTFRAKLPASRNVAGNAFPTERRPLYRYQ